MSYLMAALMAIVATVTLARAVGAESSPNKPLLEPGKVRVQPVALPKPEGLVATLKTYPRTSGSTSAEPMGVWIACRLLCRECQ